MRGRCEAGEGGIDAKADLEQVGKSGKGDQSSFVRAVQDVTLCARTVHRASLAE